MNFNQFLEVIDAAVAELPNDVVDKLDNVVFVGEEGDEESPLGEYIGIPRIDRIGDPTGMLPDRIVLYHNSILEECGGDDALIHEEIRRTLWHEIGHHLGWEDNTLIYVEKKRGWRADDDVNSSSHDH